jgi:hypothetical protein
MAQKAAGVTSVMAQANKVLAHPAPTLSYNHMPSKGIMAPKMPFRITMAARVNSVPSSVKVHNTA